MYVVTTLALLLQVIRELLNINSTINILLYPSDIIFIVP